MNSLVVRAQKYVAVLENTLFSTVAVLQLVAVPIQQCLNTPWRAFFKGRKRRKITTSKYRSRLIDADISGKSLDQVLEKSDKVSVGEL